MAGMIDLYLFVVYYFEWIAFIFCYDFTTHKMHMWVKSFYVAYMVLIILHNVTVTSLCLWGEAAGPGTGHPSEAGSVSFWPKNDPLHLVERLCKYRWVKVNGVGDVSGGAIGARRTRGVARCDRLNWRRGKSVRGAVPIVFICVLLILVNRPSTWPLEHVWRNLRIGFDERYLTSTFILVICILSPLNKQIMLM